MTQDAWRQHFTGNAADLLAIIRWAEGLTDEQFKHLLLAAFRFQRRAAGKINSATVERMLQVRRHLTEEKEK